MSKRVLLAEDHAIVIKGIKIIFETEFRDYKLDVVKSADGLMRNLKANDYDMAIIDLQLEDGDTFRLIGDIVKIYPRLIILIFTANPEELYAHRLYKAGVKGYLNKTSDDYEIIKAIRHTLAGNVYMSENLKSYIVGNPEKRTKLNPLEKLTNRELEVANLLKLGKKPSEICNELSMHASTMTTFKMKIFAKLNVTNIIDLNKIFENYESDK